MLSGKSQAATTPTALGSLLQASTYGATIPTIYGMTISPLLAIWAANLRQGGSVKKFKQLKKGITAYVENIDFLLGHNPILGVGQMWNNGSTIPLDFTAASVGGTPPHTLASSSGHIQIGDFPGGTPDPNFYAVIGVTIAVPYSVTFDDYGGTGPQTLSGTYEVPLWNELMIGPDPTHGSATRNYPYCYRWQPSYGPYFYIDNSDFFTNIVTVYYSVVTAATSNQGPLAHNRLSFEPQLGSGTEYADADLSAQQIIYPMYAGIGSSDIDLGSSGALPQLQAEVQGKFGLYHTGDADFADIIEDVVKSGVAQAAIGDGPTTSQVEHGLSSYQYPGCIQLKFCTSVEMFTQGPQTYNMAVTEGNYLVVIANTLGIGGGTVSITDSSSNSWTAVFGTGNQQVWYAVANASVVLTVSIGGQGNNWAIVLIEVAGVDTLDSISIGANGTAATTTTNVNGQPGYLLGVSLYATTPAPNPVIPQWDSLTAPNNYRSLTNGFSLQERVVYSPDGYSLTIPTGGLLDQCLFAFKGSNPPTYPKPLGDFMDVDSLNLVRLQCRANGLWGSLSMNSQQAASDWLKTLYDAADAAPIFAGFELFSMPYSEVSAVGNGAIYNAPTAGGPVFNLSTENGDFLASNNDAPLKVQTAARVDQDNVLQMQCVNRTSNYNPSLVEQPDAVSISLFGIRKADPITNNAVQDVSIARQLLGIQVRKLQYGGDSYTFTVPAKWCLLCPMGAGGGGNSDAVITVSDPLASIFNIPVRITSVSEQSDQSLECEAEPFVYGMYAPTVSTSIIATDTPSPYQANPTLGGGTVQINPPIIFEATPRLAAQTSPAQIWIATSSSASTYGGCQCYISTDGGLSYTPASSNPTIGSAMQAEVGISSSQGEWPSGTDPDTTNNLYLSFSETLPDPPGTLPSYSATQRDNFQYPCYVGFSNLATAQANYTDGDTSQITGLGVLFSDPTILNALPSDAVIQFIFPMTFIEAGPTGSPIVTQIFGGTGMTPTSGGTSIEGPITGDISAAVPLGGGASIGTSLTGQEIRCSWDLTTNGAPASLGGVESVGWAIYYTSATPSIDPLTLIPFSPPAGVGWGWAIPKTVATGMVGTGSNATVAAFGGIAPVGIGYELMTYNEATLLAPGNYELMATGSGNELRRGVYGAPSPGVGMNHPPGSPFALLDPSDAGLFKINMDPIWIGTQLWFKFPTFNKFGSVLNGLDDVAAYPYTPTGIAGNIGPATGGILVNGN